MTETQKSQEEIVVSPGRNIVSSTADDFRKEMHNAVNKGVKKLVIDFNGVEMVDSIGIGALVSTFKTVNKNDGSMSLINVSEDICRLFKAMRLDRIFDVIPIPH